MTQLDLLSGCYHCHNCGALDALAVRRAGRFRLCPACAAAVLPDFEGEATTPAQRDQIAAYWAWHFEMQRRYPTPPPVGMRASRPPLPRSAGEHIPTCVCGQPRPPLDPVAAFDRDLFGGPFHTLCPICETKASIDALLCLAAAIHPDYDDEDWLDLLSRSHPEAFTLGVLPAYWFQRTRVPNA